MGEPQEAHHPLNHLKTASLVLVLTLAVPALAEPHVFGPAPLSETDLREIAGCELMLHEQVDSTTRAIFYSDDRIALWFDPTTGGFLRGIWVLEDGVPVTGRDSNGGQGAVNLLFCQGHRILMDLNGRRLGQPEMQVRELDTAATELTFNGTVFDGDQPSSAYRIRYRIRHDRRIIEAAFDLDAPLTGAGPVWVIMDTMGEPKPGAGDLESRPVSGLTCGAWNVTHHSLFRQAEPTKPLSTYRARTEGVSIVSISGGAGRPADLRYYRVNGPDMRSPWVGVYNGNWDERGYRFGVDYSIAREFMTPERVEFADFVETPWQGVRGGEYRFARTAIAVAHAGGRPFQWEERIHVNRGDYQTYLRKGGH